MFVDHKYVLLFNSSCTNVNASTVIIACIFKIIQVLFVRNSILEIKTKHLYVWKAIFVLVCLLSVCKWLKCKCSRLQLHVYKFNLVPFLLLSMCNLAHIQPALTLYCLKEVYLAG